MSRPPAWPFPAKVTGLWWCIQSRSVIAVVGIVSKIYLRILNRTRTHNMDILHNLAENRPNGVPLVTVSNHMSCLDDPVLWGLLNLKILTSCSSIRWTLGANEILFSRKWHSLFFSRGKIIPVIRGDGVYQRGMDYALDMINRGQWVHIFPEGKVNQEAYNRRLKWGVGRLIAEANVNPIVLPFWHFGMEDILPEKRPYRPQIGQTVTFLVGEPMTFDGVIEEYRQAKKTAEEARKQITDLIQERFQELKEQTRQLHEENKKRL